MALSFEFDPKNQKKQLSEESKGRGGEIIRNYEPEPGVNWRFGLPNYAKVNGEYFKGRTKVHAADSLEAVVSSIVKNWEVESHHIADPKQWKTMDASVFTVSLNSGEAQNAQTMADIGPYNLLIGEVDGYKASQQTFESANEIFSSVFPNGFPWECVEVYAGPPDVRFRWRHWGRFTGTFKDDKGAEFKGDGRTIEFFGECVATLNADMKITRLQVSWDQKDLIGPLRAADLTSCPVAAASPRQVPGKSRL